MGKKSNWTATEDLALCHAWLNANAAVLAQPAGDQKAATFWSVVCRLFRAEVRTAIERPQNGLKIRWTRIKCDVVKFARVLAHTQALAAAMKGATAAASDAHSVDSIENDAYTEQQDIDDAKELFYNEYATKFHFEACWELLRHSLKWTQLLANSAGASATSPQASTTPTNNASSTSTHNTSSMSTHHVSTAPTRHVSSTPTHHFIGSDAMPQMEDVTAVAAEIVSPVDLHTNGGSDSSTSSDNNNNDIAEKTADSSNNIDTSDIGPSSSCSSNGTAGTKRLALALLETNAATGSIQQQKQLQDVTSCLVDELRRHNELLEEQNAIALLQVAPHTIEDADARECLEMLRRRQFKRMRATMMASGSANAAAAASSVSVSVASTALPTAAVFSRSVNTSQRTPLAASNAAGKQQQKQQQQKYGI